MQYFACTTKFLVECPGPPRNQTKKGEEHRFTHRIDKVLRRTSEFRCGRACRGPSLVIRVKEINCRFSAAERGAESDGGDHVNGEEPYVIYGAKRTFPLGIRERSLGAQRPQFD